MATIKYSTRSFILNETQEDNKRRPHRVDCSDLLTNWARVQLSGSGWAQYALSLVCIALCVWSAYIKRLAHAQIPPFRNLHRDDC